MKIFSKLRFFFCKSLSVRDSPIVILTKSSDTKEFLSIDEAVKELESDPDISKEKIEKLKESIEMLKNKRRIKIKNGNLIN
ncbi:MAG: hypothetical protein EHM58_00350 [Ignavibacteriae bacterium]|nr:MAG: hypothetical protein EHM58_00350 [Ignavibacteriota bacterium]